MNASFEETHVISFCFDDGYRASCEAIAEIFEARGIAAAFCVLSDPVNAEDALIRAGKIGDFSLWRALAHRGHEVMPHGHHHVHLGNATPEIAKAEIEAALAGFAAGMGEDAPSQIVYHCAYNQLPGALVDWIRPRVAAVRATVTNAGISPLYWGAGSLLFDAAFPLPPHVGDDARARLERFLAGPPAWITLCFHGLDHEGWGPLQRDQLERLLDLAMRNATKVFPPGAVIHQLRSTPK
jgi:peptidoglycan/xylan/chitin deacetylase (PgdA/CDA1 family)